MWLGDKVTCSSAEEMWLNEGWATFFQMYYGIELYGYDFFKEEMRDMHRGVLQYCHTPGGDGDYFVLNDIPQTHTYGMTAYDRGSTVVQAMRFYLGDSLFFDALAAYTDAFAYNSASSYDMRDFFTARSGVDMTGFFDNWVLNAGTPHYSLDYFETMAAGPNYETTVYLKNKRKGPAFIGNDHIVEVTFMSSDWQQHTERASFSGETGDATFLVPFEPVAVFIDLEEKMCDATTDSYKVIDETGSYGYSKTFLEIEVLDIVDSAFIQVTHNWAPPDSLEEPVNGLRLSDYRYWTVTGVLPETFVAKGYFFYTINSYLDNTLLTGPTDSVILMHRANAQEDWQEIGFEQLGNWTVGNLIVEDLEMGDYTLAVWDTQVGVKEEGNNGIQRIKVYPNPANDIVNVNTDYNQGGYLEIVSSRGEVLNKVILEKGTGLIEIATKGLMPGVYLVKLVDQNKNTLGSTKLIIE
jgi:aminopeptidase N